MRPGPSRKQGEARRLSIDSHTAKGRLTERDTEGKNQCTKNSFGGNNSTGMSTERNCSERHFLSLSASVQWCSILVRVLRWLKYCLIQVSVGSSQDSCSLGAARSSLFHL